MTGERNSARKERRRFERFSCAAVACSCSVWGESSSKKHGAILSNISTGGVSFETNLEAVPGERLRIGIRPIEGPEFEARIKVVHSRRSQRVGFFVVGSRFEDLTEGARRSLLVLLNTVGRLERDLSQE